MLENLGGGLQKSTGYGGTQFIFYASGGTPQINLPLILIQKNKNYPLNSQFFPIGVGLRESWGLNVSGNRDEDILLTTGGGEYHVALVQSNQSIRIYFDGNLVRTLESVESIPAGQVLNSVFQTLTSKGEIIFTQETGSVISSESFAEGPKSGFRCYRFTPGQALYSGNSFTPPTSITDLA